MDRFFVPTGVSNASRRDFLRTSGTAALMIGFALPLAGGRALAADTVAPFSPSAYLRITPDGRITVVCGSAEMGQGVLTAIPMLLAEELDADWKRVSVEQAPVDKAFNNPMFGMQATGGSTMVRAHWEPLRKAGAAAREMLVAAAAAQWKVDASSLRTADSEVIAPDGQKLGYGALVAATTTQAVPSDPKLKDPEDFKLLGQPLKRLDTPPKVNGTARFGLDAQVPGMLVAVMARAAARHQAGERRRHQGQGRQGRAAGDHNSQWCRRAGDRLLGREEGPRRARDPVGPGRERRHVVGQGEHDDDRGRRQRQRGRDRLGQRA